MFKANERKWPGVLAIIALLGIVIVQVWAQDAAPDTDQSTQNPCPTGLGSAPCITEPGDGCDEPYTEIEMDEIFKPDPQFVASEISNDQGSTSPIVICVGGSVTFSTTIPEDFDSRIPRTREVQVSFDPENDCAEIREYGEWIEDEAEEISGGPIAITWSASDGGSISPTSGTSATFSSSTPGIYTVTATFSDTTSDSAVRDDDVTVPITVVVMEIKLSTPSLLCVNGDDDDKNGVPDKNHDPIHRTDDELVGFTVDYEPKDFKVGSIQLSSSGSIAIWNDQMKSGRASSVPLNDLPKTFYVEGVETGTGTISADYPPLDCGEEAELLVIEVDSLNWIGVAGSDGETNLEGNPASHGGGNRIFPGKNFEIKSTGYGLSGTHDKVKIKVRLSSPVPAGESVVVHLAPFDVDDPTQNFYFDSSGNPAGANFLDPRDTQTTFPGGDNNQGDIGIRPLITSVTIPAGMQTAEVEFTITGFYAGNNFKVFASCVRDLLADIEVDPDVENGKSGVNSFRFQFKPTGGAPYEKPGTNHSSPLLSVWRKLHVERDFMFKPTPNQVSYTSTGPAKSVTLDTSIKGAINLYDVDLGIALPSDWGVEDQLEEGTIAFSGCPSGSQEFVIYSNPKRSIFGNSHVIVVGKPGTCALSGAFTIKDDDDPDVLPHLPSAGALGDTAFADAYIVLNYLPSAVSDPVLFDLNISASEFAFGGGTGGWASGHDLSSSREFWTHLVVGCFQGSLGEDFDPDELTAIPGTPVTIPTKPESATLGETRPSSTFLTSRTAIYLEVLRDWRKISPTSIETENWVVAHELGHGGGGEHSDKGLMSDNDKHRTDRFTTQTIRRFRTNESAW